MNNKELETFWEQDEKAHHHNCFNLDASQAALGIRMNDECVFTELGVYLVSERAPKKYLFCKKDNEVMRVSGLLFWGNGSFSEASQTPNTTDATEWLEASDVASFRS